MKQGFLTLLLSFLTLMIAWADGSLYAPQSQFSAGKWVKIRVNETGIYKLTYAELAKMGFPQPDKVSIHGYGGWMLDEKFSNQYIDDVPTVAVWKGKDYLLFYAKGPLKWQYGSKSFSMNSSVFQFIHENNPYSTYGYYFVTDADSAKTMTSVASLDNGAALPVNTFDDYMLYEQDLVSVNNSGRELFGESFESNTSRTFSFSIPGITGDAGRVSFRFISKAVGSAGRVTLGIDGKEMMSGSIRVDDYAYTTGVEYSNSVAWNGDKNENTTVTVTYNPSGHKSYLDYIYLQMKRDLKSYAQNGKPYTFFRSLASRSNISTFTIRDATSDMLVLDVTDGINPAVMETSFNNAALSFTIPASAALREFAVIDLSKSFKSPEIIGQVPNQNLHALPQTDMVILAPPIFTTEAKRLADYHLLHNPVIDNITIVTPEQVYNEFSSGTPDATAIRRFMKMFYDRSASDADAPKYLLLFGDGSYDNRRLTDVWKKTPTDNFILTYQSQNSINIDSYMMDDYYGFLGDNSGGGDNTTDDIMLGIGRFPVQNTTQAKLVVDKVIAYMDNGTTGAWKNNLCFLADDGSNLDIPPYDTIHVSQSNRLADKLEQQYPEFMINKLFFDAYKKSTIGGRTTYPDIIAGLQKQLKEGTMLLNYTGHGNNSSLSDEQVITSSDIRQATYPYLPLWITATCDFTPFDGFETSAGEEVFLNPKSGGIALFTTTRVAFSDPNFIINELLLTNLFKKENGRRLTLGEVIRATKQSYKLDSRLRFTLIGDPALTLAFPEYQINITEINGEPVSNKEFNFRALESITVKGEILSPNGQQASGFNGMMYSTITDSRQTITTLDNNRTGNTFQYEDYPNILFKGNERVNNGEFSFTFTVPKDITYSNKLGKMSLYAVDEQSNTEAQGSFLRFRVGGTDENAPVDSIGPEIRALYLNDSTFRDGGQVNDTPFFVAVLWDQRGINIAGSSIGHDLMLVIDQNPLYSYNLNAYYEINPGSNGEGYVRFSIPTLPSGVHTAEFKAWNVLNQSTTRTFTFEVVEGFKPRITNLTASPVPARENVNFQLTHSLPESKMTINIRVYDMMGRLCWDYEETGVSGLFQAHTITWNLTDGSGKRLLPGVYIYRAAIRTSTSTEVTEAKKLIILGR